MNGGNNATVVDNPNPNASAAAVSVATPLIVVTPEQNEATPKPNVDHSLKVENTPNDDLKESKSTALSMANFKHTDLAELLKNPVLTPSYQVTRLQLLQSHLEAACRKRNGSFANSDLKPGARVIASPGVFKADANSMITLKNINSYLEIEDTKEIDAGTNGLLQNQQLQSHLMQMNFDVNIDSNISESSDRLQYCGVIMPSTSQERLNVIGPNPTSILNHFSAESEKLCEIGGYPQGKFDIYKVRSVKLEQTLYKETLSVKNDTKSSESINEDAENLSEENTVANKEVPAKKIDKDSEVVRKEVIPELTNGCSESNLDKSRSINKLGVGLKMLLSRWSNKVILKLENNASGANKRSGKSSVRKHNDIVAGIHRGSIDDQGKNTNQNSPKYNSDAVTSETLKENSEQVQTNIADVSKEKNEDDASAEIMNNDENSHKNSENVQQRESDILFNEATIQNGDGGKPAILGSPSQNNSNNCLAMSAPITMKSTSKTKRNETKYIEKLPKEINCINDPENESKTCMDEEQLTNAEGDKLSGENTKKCVTYVFIKAKPDLQLDDRTKCLSEQNRVPVICQKNSHPKYHVVSSQHPNFIKCSNGNCEQPMEIMASKDTAKIKDSFPCVEQLSQEQHQQQTPESFDKTAISVKFPIGDELFIPKMFPCSPSVDLVRNPYQTNSIQKSSKVPAVTLQASDADNTLEIKEKISLNVEGNNLLLLPKCFSKSCDIISNSNKLSLENGEPKYDCGVNIELLNSNNSNTNINQKTTGCATGPVSKIDSFAIRKESFAGFEQEMLPLGSEIIQTNSSLKCPLISKKENILDITKENDTGSLPSSSTPGTINILINRNSEQNLTKRLPENLSSKYEMITTSQDILNDGLTTNEKSIRSELPDSDETACFADKDARNETDSSGDPCKTKKINVPIFAFEKTKLRDIISLLGCKLIETSNSSKCQFSNNSKASLENNNEIKEGTINPYACKLENRAECKPGYIVSISPEHKLKNLTDNNGSSVQKEKEEVFKDGTVSSNFETSDTTAKDSSKVLQLENADDVLKPVTKETVSKKDVPATKAFDESYTLKKAGVLFALTDMIGSGTNRLAFSDVVDAETSRASSSDVSNEAVSRDNGHTCTSGSNLDKNYKSISNDANGDKNCGDLSAKYAQKTQTKISVEENEETNVATSVKRQNSTNSFGFIDDRSSNVRNNESNERLARNKRAEEFTFEIPRFAYVSIEEMDNKLIETDKSKSLPKMTNYRISLQKELLSPSSGPIGESGFREENSNTSLRIEGKLTGQERCSITKRVCGFISGKYGMNENGDGDHRKRDIRVQFDEEEVNIYSERANGITSYIRPNKMNDVVLTENLTSSDLPEKIKASFCTGETDSTSGVISLNSSQNLSAEQLKDAVVIDNDLIAASVVDKITYNQNGNFGVDNFFYDPLAYIIESMPYSLVDGCIGEEEFFCKESKIKGDMESIGEEPIKTFPEKNTMQIVTSKIIVKDTSDLLEEEAARKDREESHQLTLNTGQNESSKENEFSYFEPESNDGGKEKTSVVELPNSLSTKLKINPTEMALYNSVESSNVEKNIVFDISDNNVSNSGPLNSIAVSNGTISSGDVASRDTFVNNVQSDDSNSSNVASSSVVSNDVMTNNNVSRVCSSINAVSNGNTGKCVASDIDVPTAPLTNASALSSNIASNNYVMKYEEGCANNRKCSTIADNDITAFPVGDARNISTEVACRTKDINFSLSNTKTAKSKQNSITISLDDVATTHHCRDRDGNEDIAYIQENLARYIMENVANITYPKPSDLIGIGYNFVNTNNDPIEKAFRSHCTEMYKNTKQSSSSPSPEILDNVRNSSKVTPFHKTVENCLDLVKMDIANVSKARIGVKDYVTCLAINVGDNTCYIQKNTIQQAQLKMANNTTEKLLVNISDFIKEQNDDKDTHNASIDDQDQNSLCFKTVSEGKPLQEFPETISEKIFEQKERLVAVVTAKKAEKIYEISEQNTIELGQNVNGKLKVYKKNHANGLEEMLISSEEKVQEASNSGDVSERNCPTESPGNNTQKSTVSQTSNGNEEETEETNNPSIQVLNCQFNTNRNEKVPETKQAKVISDSKTKITIESVLIDTNRTLPNGNRNVCDSNTKSQTMHDSVNGTPSNIVTIQSTKNTDVNPPNITSQSTVDENTKGEPFAVAKDEVKHNTNETATDRNFEGDSASRNTFHINISNPEKQSSEITTGNVQNDFVNILKTITRKTSTQADDSVPLDEGATEKPDLVEHIWVNTVQNQADGADSSNGIANICDTKKSTIISVHRNVSTSGHENTSMKEVVEKKEILQTSHNEANSSKFNFDKEILDQIIETNTFPMLSENSFAYSFSSILNPLGAIVINSPNSSSGNSSPELNKNMATPTKCEEAKEVPDEPTNEKQSDNMTSVTKTNGQQRQQPNQQQSKTVSGGKLPNIFERKKSFIQSSKHTSCSPFQENNPKNKKTAVTDHIKNETRDCFAKPYEQTDRKPIIVAAPCKNISNDRATLLMKSPRSTTNNNENSQKLGQTTNFHSKVCQSSDSSHSKNVKNNLQVRKNPSDVENATKLDKPRSNIPNRKAATDGEMEKLAISNASNNNANIHAVSDKNKCSIAFSKPVDTIQTSISDKQFSDKVCHIKNTKCRNCVKSNSSFLPKIGSSVSESEMKKRRNISDNDSKMPENHTRNGKSKFKSKNMPSIATVSTKSINQKHVVPNCKTNPNDKTMTPNQNVETQIEMARHRNMLVIDPIDEGLATEIETCINRNTYLKVDDETNSLSCTAMKDAEVYYHSLPLLYKSDKLPNLVGSSFQELPPSSPLSPKNNSKNAADSKSSSKDFTDSCGTDSSKGALSTQLNSLSSTNTFTPAHMHPHESSRAKHFNGSKLNTFNQNNCRNNKCNCIRNRYLTSPNKDLVVNKKRTSAGMSSTKKKKINAVDSSNHLLFRRGKEHVCVNNMKTIPQRSIKRQQTDSENDNLLKGKLLKTLVRSNDSAGSTSNNEDNIGEYHRKCFLRKKVKLKKTCLTKETKSEMFILKLHKQPKNPSSKSNLKSFVNPKYIQEFKELEKILRETASKISKPPQVQHQPYVFSSLKPYYDTSLVRYMMRQPQAPFPSYRSRQTATGLCDPTEDLKLDTLILPEIPSKTIKRIEKQYKKEKELIRKQKANSQKKVTENWKHREKDFCRQELKRLKEVHPSNRANLLASYNAYLQNSVGSRKAITDYINKLSLSSRIK
ncbi:uncharacterized protein LOC115211134 isoform X2 [Octopus sinensis]|uniref:Uncharacterized protein LOC115211134 isoform X2 n=1 Tax=Octopus sinensis TaxID=2607531 RepID=A0A7E6ES94_9MOLL|nr:uncharacterized protein LOC115211134 isoform X2 [Octopus sinensis]